MRMHTWLTPLLLISGAAAQGLVSPANFAIAEGDRYGYGGLGTITQPSVYLGIYEDMQGRPATIKGVSFRRDGHQSGDKTTYPAENWFVTVYISTAVTTAASPDATLAKNHGPDKTRVAGPFHLVSFPETNYSGPAEPFDYQITFPQPYAWAGNGPLCIEIQVETRSPGGKWFYVDFTAYSSYTNPPLLYRSTGTGCTSTDHTQPMTLTPGATSQWSSGAVTLGYTGSFMPKTTTTASIVALLIGARTSLGGLPLPLEIPLTAIGPGGLSYSGPCYLHNDVIVTVYGIADATGAMTKNLGLPVSSAYNGLNLYTTAVGFDAGANYLGAVTSNGTQHHLVAPWTSAGVGCVYKDGAPIGTGTVLANQGYVLRFDT